MNKIPAIRGIPNLFKRSFIKAKYPRFLMENDADTPASKNISGINHGEINVTMDAIGLILSKKI